MENVETIKKLVCKKCPDRKKLCKRTGFYCVDIWSVNNYINKLKKRRLGK